MLGCEPQHRKVACSCSQGHLAALAFPLPTPSQAHVRAGKLRASAVREPSPNHRQGCGIQSYLFLPAHSGPSASYRGT